LLTEMGVASRRPDGSLDFDETQLCRAPQERLFLGDRWYEGLWPAAAARPDDQRELDAFNAEVARWSELRDGRGRRAFAVPMAHGSDDADVTALDKSTFAAWLD